MFKSKVVSLVLTLLSVSILFVGCGDDNQKPPAPILTGVEGNLFFMVEVFVLKSLRRRCAH